MTRWILTCLALLPALLLAGSETRNLTLAAESLDILRIDCGSGSLDVRGVEGLSEIRVRAEIVSDDASGKELLEWIEERVELRLEQSGSRGRLVSKVESRGWTWGGNSLAINLTVEMPKRLALDIDDGSGSMSVRDIDGDIRIHDGSGSMDVRNVGGRLDVDDGSGSITIRGVAGRLSVEDGSGSMTLEDIRGDVDIDDGSGSITVDGVAGDLHIRESGSGSVAIRNVDGSVRQDD